MAFIGWDSQPLEDWAPVHPPGYMVKLDGRRTHFIMKGEGPPVILIHGFNLDHNTWSANTDVLARYFRVYAVDLWGSGYSTREPLDYGFPLFVEQIRLLMDHLDLGRAHLVGHSMGGGTAIAFSVANPERVGRLVLVDSVGIPRPTTLRERVFRLPWLPEFLQSLPIDLIRRKNLRDFWISPMRSSKPSAVIRRSKEQLRRPSPCSGGTSSTPWMTRSTGSASSRSRP